jgi:hypothetical protein
MVFLRSLIVTSSPECWGCNRQVAHRGDEEVPPACHDFTTVRLMRPVAWVPRP